MCLFAIHMSSFMMSSEISCPFNIGRFDDSSVRALYTIMNAVHLYVVSIFSQSVSCLIIFLRASFD